MLLQVFVLNPEIPAMGRQHLVCALLAGLLSTWASAAPDLILDEYGSIGGPLAGGVHLISPPGAPPTYLLPFAVVAGDVWISEPASTSQSISDLIRFQGQVVTFLSDLPELGEIPAPADVPLPGPPGLLMIPEIGAEGLNYADYAPGPNDPGGAPPGVPPITYRFISDGVVPLPTALPLGAAGLSAVAVARSLRRRFRNKLDESNSCDIAGVSRCKGVRI